MTAKVSVIIPVYNTERYLEQCLDSVVNQSLNDIEIICVDDGSTDRSPDILRQYGEKDGRVRIVSRENGGLGNARNSGMEIATGEFISFIDSDDWFDLTALEKLYMKAAGDDADVCMCGRMNHPDYFNEGAGYRILPNRRLYPQEYPFCINHPDGLIGFSDIPVWNKLFRRAFLEDNRIRFLPVIRAEDINFTTVALCTASRITILYESLIHYRSMRPESLTATLYKDPEQYVDIWLTTAEELRKRGAHRERCVANLAWASFLWVMQRTRWPEFKHLYNRLRAEALPELGIIVREPGYFFYPWQEKLLEHLYQENAEQFLLSYLFAEEMRIQESRMLKQVQI